MVQPCEELWDWTWSCDVSNLQTMTIEIIIAGILAGIAIGAAFGFYYKEKSDREESEKIIKKQGKRIAEQEKEQKIHEDNAIDSFRFNFKSARNMLATIKENRTKCDTPEIFKNTFSHDFDILDTFQSQIMKSVTEEHKWLDEETIPKIDFARAGIAVYVKQMRELDPHGFIGFEAATDPSGAMKRIDDVLNWLPDPRPMA